jgi:hypothetical protein
MLSQMHSGNGLWQCGQSGIAAATPVSGSDCFDMRPLYAARRRASTTQGRFPAHFAGASIAPDRDRTPSPRRNFPRNPVSAT